MQCPRCYFTNPAGSRVCEYCGARLEGTTDVGGGGGGSASEKRKTMLGPMPAVAAGGARAKKRPARIDPDDPFRIAAEGVRAPKPPRVESVAPVPPPRPAEPTTPPIDDPVVRNRRNTIVTLARPEEPSIAGAAIVIPAAGPSRAVLIREGRTRIGRREGVEIEIDDPKASTDHALVRIEGGEAWLLDTSANGTTVSGVDCVNDRADLADGAVLRVGDTLVVLKLLGEEALAHLAGES